MPRYTFTYPSVPDAENSMYDHVKEVLVANQVDQAECQRFMVAISEAFTNAYLHGNKTLPGKHISITLTINKDWVTADIIDEGTDGYAKAMETISGVVGLPDSGAENGRGLALIRHYADDVSFSRAPNGGLKVTFRLKRGIGKETGITQL